MATNKRKAQLTSEMDSSGARRGGRRYLNSAFPHETEGAHRVAAAARP